MNIAKLAAISAVLGLAAFSGAAAGENPALEQLRGAAVSINPAAVDPAGPDLSNIPPGWAYFMDLPACGIVDAAFLAQPALKDAVTMLAPCAVAVSEKYGIPVAVYESGGGIEIRIGENAGKPKETYNAFKALAKALKPRENRLFGYDTVLTGDFPPTLTKSARGSRIDCRITVDGGLNTVSFAVAGLGTANAELLPLGDDEFSPVIEGENNPHIQAMNGQGGELWSDQNGITLVGDNAGCTYIKLFLYKDSGFTRGWASESGSEMDPWYTSDVSCRVSAL